MEYCISSVIKWFYKKNIVIVGIIFICAVLSRHNALIQAYPIFFIYAWIIVQKLKQPYRCSKYITLLFVFAIITILITIGIPQLLKTTEAHPARHIFLHQIAGACIPNHDSTCFNQEWYRKGKTFANVERQYLEYPLDADGMTAERKYTPPFNSGNGLIKAWITSILKYPFDYFEHIERFRKKMWNLPSTAGYFVPLNRTEHCLCREGCAPLKNKYPSKELFYIHSPLKIKIYNSLKNLLPKIRPLAYISLNFVLSALALFFFFKKNDILLLYVISVSLGGILSSFIFCYFSPVPAARYIYPVLASTVASVIGSVTYLLEYRLRNTLKQHKNVQNELLETGKK